jgi:GT2 family glycosyltransferase
MSYYNFNFKNYLEVDITKNFVVEQVELLLKDEYTNSTFKKVSVKYECKFLKQNNWNCNIPTLIICIKDNENLLSFTLQNLKKFNVLTSNNIIIVDDRSSSDNIKKLSIENECCYLRIDNYKGFNFSMLNNIAALVAKILGSKEIILWNSDLWCDSQDILPTILEKHRKENSTISGTRLIYPSKDMSFHEEEDFSKDFGGKKDWYESIQFGGSRWLNTSDVSPIIFSPVHFGRFKNKDDSRFKCDKGEDFITGAFQILDLDWFIEIGGLNPSLSKNFQDVDICLKALKDNKNIFYFGKEYFYHDESVSLKKEGKNDLQLKSDHVLFGKIWNDEIPKLVLQ